MPNMIDYVWNNLETFEEDPLNEVDSLILSWLSYLRFEACTLPKDGSPLTIHRTFRAEIFKDFIGDVNSPEETKHLVAACAASPRFRSIPVLFYKEDFDVLEAKQFAACTFRISPMLHYVAFRGTDNTLTGWREDFNLSLVKNTPSQNLAAQYLEEVASKVPGHFIVGGHSKGGHLAVYAAAKAPDYVQVRLDQVYSHDGPGFLNSDFDTTGLLAIRDKIKKTIPQSSLVGMFFEQECPVDIIDSKKLGIMQHNALYWQVEGKQLVRRSKLTPDAQIIQNRFNDWIDSFTQKERVFFINTLFDILEDTGASSFRELGDNFTKSLPSIVKASVKLDPYTRKFMLKAVGKLIKGSKPHERALLQIKNGVQKQLGLVDTGSEESKADRPE